MKLETSEFEKEGKLQEMTYQQQEFEDEIRRKQEEIEHIGKMRKEAEEGQMYLLKRIEETEDKYQEREE